MTTRGAPAGTADAAPDPARARPARRPLGAYTDRAGRRREIVTRPGAHGSTLVIDEDAATLGDRRLVAHLARDEPAANARLVCDLYLADPAGRFARSATVADWHRAPGARPEPGVDAWVLTDARGRRYRLAVRAGRWGGGELRWTESDPPDGTTMTVGLRDVVGALEAYQPACRMTETAIAGPPDALVSTHALAGELERLYRSRTVLNRPLREAVQAAVADGLSLSQIATRCGRPKSRRAQPHVGDTSWLGRRIGLLPEARREEPSPWIDADVLAVIARDGLGIDPRHVEPA
jgi:hypothetical protein